MNSQNSFKVSIDGFKKGLYVVSLLDGNTLYTTKVMKK